MKVSDIKEFTSIWALAALDEGSSVLTFEPEGEFLTVSFSGMHVGATRMWRLQDVAIEGLSEGMPCSVPGATFIGTLALFSEGSEITVRATPTELQMRAGGRSAKVRRADSGARFRMPPMVVQSSVIIDRGALGPKLQLLSGVASRTLDRPALTGINVSVSANNQLVLRATDGHAKACMVSFQAREIAGEGFRFTAPAADISTALAECERIVKMELGDSGGILHISDEVTFVRISLIRGEYPTFQHLPRKFRSKLIIPSALVQTATKAAALLSADGLVTLAVREGRLGMFVTDREKGEFDVLVGDTTEDAFEMNFDANYLGQVANAAGLETVVQLASPQEPVMVSGDGWYYWLTSVYRNF